MNDFVANYGVIAAFVYLEAVNLLALLMMGADKLLAKKHRRRIPEAALMGAAVLGGSLGAIAGMLLFRHKTRHLKFYLGLPAILFVQLLVVFIYILGH